MIRLGKGVQGRDKGAASRTEGRVLLTDETLLQAEGKVFLATGWSLRNLFKCPWLRKSLVISSP